MDQGLSRTIHKLAAARTQLQTAIQLWFADGDPVSIHTLTCAALQILHDIHVQRGGSPLLFDSIFVKNHRRAEWDQAVKEHMNFFKHADRDPTGTIAFDPSLTEPFILLSLLTVEALGVPHTLEESAFGFWCCLHEHDWLSEQGQTVFINDIPVEQLAKLRDLQRQKFYGMYKFLIENHIIKK